MELTWEMAGQYLFLAALFASVLGLGKVFVIMTTIEWHARKVTGKTADDIKERKKAVSLTIYVGLTEMFVGILIMIAIFLFGDLDAQGREVIMVLGLIFFVLVIILSFVANKFIKGLETAT